MRPPSATIRSLDALLRLEIQNKEVCHKAEPTLGFFKEHARQRRQSTPDIRMHQRAPSFLRSHRLPGLVTCLSFILYTAAQHGHIMGKRMGDGRCPTHMKHQPNRTAMPNWVHRPAMATGQEWVRPDGAEPCPPPSPPMGLGASGRHTIQKTPPAAAVPTPSLVLASGAAAGRVQSWGPNSTLREGRSVQRGVGGSVCCCGAGQRTDGVVAGLPQCRNRSMLLGGTRGTAPNPPIPKPLTHALKHWHLCTHARTHARMVNQAPATASTLHAPPAQHPPDHSPVCRSRAQ